MLDFNCSHIGWLPGIRGTAAGINDDKIAGCEINTVTYRDGKFGEDIFILGGNQVYVRNRCYCWLRFYDESI